LCRRNAAFDALAGIGTGTRVSEARGLIGNELAVAERLIDAWWTNDLINALAAAGSIAWVLAMFAATVALTSPDRRRPIAGVVVVLFVVGGWARGRLFLAPDGVTITRAWWLLTLGMAALMFLVGKPRMTGTLLILAGAFFGAYHVPPTGPLGATCFLAAAVLIELEKRKQRKMTSICGAV